MKAPRKFADVQTKKACLITLGDLPALQITERGLANFIARVEEMGPKAPGQETQIRLGIRTLASAVRGGNELAGKALLRLARDLVDTLEALIDEKAMAKVISAAILWPLLVDETVTQKNHNDSVLKRLKDHGINAGGAAKTFKGPGDSRTLRWNFGSEINRLRGLFEGLAEFTIPASKRLLCDQPNPKKALARATRFLDEGARRISPALFVKAKDMLPTDLAWEWLVEQTNGTPERLKEIRGILIGAQKSQTERWLNALSKRRNAAKHLTQSDPKVILLSEVASPAVETELREVLRGKFYAAIPSSLKRAS
jgi:hypothetical protein